VSRSAPLLEAKLIAEGVLYSQKTECMKAIQVSQEHDSLLRFFSALRVSAFATAAAAAANFAKRRESKKNSFVRRRLASYITTSSSLSSSATFNNVDPYQCRNNPGRTTSHQTE